MLLIYSQSIFINIYYKKYANFIANHLFFSYHVWEGKEENANKHVIFNSSWPISVWLSICDQMNSRKLELPVFRCRTTVYPCYRSCRMDPRYQYFFRGSSYQDFIENIYSLNCVVFRQVLINNCKLYIFLYFFQVLLTDDGHFVFSSKIFLKRVLRSPRFQPEIGFEAPKTFESSNRGSIMPPQLHRTRDLTNRGITGPHCTNQI